VQADPIDVGAVEPLSPQNIRQLFDGLHRVHVRGDEIGMRRTDIGMRFIEAGGKP
jgi:hypothetical protein